jgi:hypothetical protein
VEYERRQGYGVIEEKLKNIHEDILELNNKVGIQNGRIFKLEKWQAFILGGTALVGVIGAFLSLAVAWFHK